MAGQRLPFRRLEIFMSVAELGGFTAAARALPMAQPAVTVAIKKLERELGVLLFRRDRTGVTLTPEGRVLFQHAAAIRNQLQEALNDLGAFRSLEAGEVSIGVPPMMAESVIPGVLAAFKREYPKLRLIVMQEGAKEIEERVRLAKLDMGVIADWRASAGLHVERLAPRRMVACASKRSPLHRARHLTWKQLFSHPLILFPSSYYQRQLLDQMSLQTGSTLQISVEAESVPLIIELVTQGVGVATLVDSVAKTYARKVTAIALPSEAEVPVAICRSAPGKMSAAAQTLWTFLKEGPLASPGPRSAP